MRSPAPWRVETEDYERQYSRERAFRVVDATGDTVCDNETHYPHSVDPDNAPLIAAAPELLAACEFALAVQVGNGTDDDEDAKRLRAAITKARGEP